MSKRKYLLGINSDVCLLLQYHKFQNHHHRLNATVETVRIPTLLTYIT